MPEPDLIQQQREILQRFRAASQQRTQAESTATNRHKTERAKADTAMSQAQQTAKAQLTKLTTEAETRHKTERSAADVVLDKTRKTANYQLTSARDAHKKAQASLNNVKLHHLLEQPSSTPPAPDHDANFSQALSRSSSLAVESAQSISATVVALKEQQRIAARMRQTLLWVALALLLILGWVGFNAYQTQQTRYAQARATAVAVATTTAVAEQAQATATAVASQAQATAVALGLDPTHVRINSVNGTIYVLVPAGEFTMGSPAGIGDDDEHPQTKVTLPAFWIGRTEVTNAQYRPFVAGGGYQQDQWWTKAGLAWRNTNHITQPAYWDDATWNRDAYPVVGVSWYEAYAYAQWLAATTKLPIRLPSEAEWEKAARGTDARTYPWGNGPPTDQLLNYNRKLGHTVAAGSYPDGKSPYGVVDLAGNVWEWTNSLYLDYPYTNNGDHENAEGDAGRVVRGGSWLIVDNRVHAAYRGRNAPDFRYDDVGVRVVVSASQ